LSPASQESLKTPFSKVVAVKGESHEIDIFSSLANSDSLQKVKVKQPTGPGLSGMFAIVSRSDRRSPSYGPALNRFLAYKSKGEPAGM
jgi:hypothetical protein